MLFKIKQKESVYLKLIRWAQRNNINIENMSSEQIIDILKLN